MEFSFTKDERLFRLVKAVENNWSKERGIITSAVFKDSHGASVDRADERPCRQCIEELFTHTRARGSVVSLTREDCIINETCVKPDPIDSDDPMRNNPYHSLIVEKDGGIGLKASKAKRLARAVRYDYLDEYGKSIRKEP